MCVWFTNEKSTLFFIGQKKVSFERIDVIVAAGTFSAAKALNFFLTGARNCRVDEFVRARDRFSGACICFYWQCFCVVFFCDSDTQVTIYANLWVKVKQPKKCVYIRFKGFLCERIALCGTSVFAFRLYEIFLFVMYLPPSNIFVLLLRCGARGKYKFHFEFMPCAEYVYITKCFEPHAHMTNYKYLSERQ